MTIAAKPVKVLGSDSYYQPKTVDRRMLLFLYQTRLGRFVLHTFLVSKWFSDLYTIYYNTPMSIRDIEPFIKAHGIDMELYQPKEFKSFNDFFIRTFKNGQREFASAPAVLPAFCEGFYSAWKNVGLYQPTIIKGQTYTLTQLFQDKDKAAPFIDGPLIIARLAPYHYHWFHYTDDGVIIDQYHIAAALHSVDPIATGQKPDILFTNKRDITIVQTINFGKITYIEVGALTVGKINQVHKTGDSVKRGEQKGYFSFGGSTVLIIGEKGKWAPCDELMTVTTNGMECAVLLGQQIAQQ